MLKPKVSPELLFAQVNELLRSMPHQQEFTQMDSSTLAWIGQASAVAHNWDSLRAIAKFDPAVNKLQPGVLHNVAAGMSELVICLHHMRHELALQTEQPLSVNVGSGLVFDYFDEIRKAIETAKVDILFIDPYLDAEFVSRYLPHIAATVTIRLLGRKSIQTLVPAVEVFKQQSNQAIQVRTATGFHDRFIIVDDSTCYQSGSSFKDGAKRAPTTITEIIDAFPAVKSTYEDIWAKATIHL